MRNAVFMRPALNTFSGLAGLAQVMAWHLIHEAFPDPAGGMALLRGASRSSRSIASISGFTGPNQKPSLRGIGELMGRDASTISRELGPVPTLLGAIGPSRLTVGRWPVADPPVQWAGGGPGIARMVAHG
jgi:hypothetical protein